LDWECGAGWIPKNLLENMCLVQNESRPDPNLKVEAINKRLGLQGM